MIAPTPAEQALKDGDPTAALKLLQEQIRAQPADAKLRVFLFQLLCVQGQWERALNQLNVAGELDAGTLPMVQSYREIILCERLRAEVYLGRKAPLLFGEPEPWIALLIEALLREGQGDAASAKALRDQAFEQAPVTSGKLDGVAFEWIADGDMRLGPVLEAIINGHYYWVPLHRISAIRIEEPADLRDQVWMPATLTFANGGETVAFIPTRYPGSENSADPRIRLARLTDWQETALGAYIGLGLRMFATDQGEYPLMGVREISLDSGHA